LVTVRLPGLALSGFVIPTVALPPAEIVAGLPEAVEPLDYYHELDPTLFSIGSDTFLGSLYAMLGMASIADAAGGGYPQLSAEFVIAADVYDLIFELNP